MENHLVNMLLMMDQPCIPEESLFHPCVSDLHDDNVNKIIIYAVNTTPRYTFASYLNIGQQFNLISGVTDTVNALKK